MTNPTSGIRFSSVFSKEGTDHIVQNGPGSDLDGLVRVWPNASGLEARLLCSFTDDVPDYCVQNQLGLRFISGCLSDFGQTDPVRKQAGVQDSLIRPASSHVNAADPDRIRHVYWAVLLTGAQSTYYLLFPVWLQKVERLGRYYFHKPLLPQ